MKYRVIFVFLLGTILLFSLQGCKPTVSVSIKSLDFGATETQKTFEVWNKTASTKMDFEITKTANWLTVNPDKGTSTGPSDKKTITVTVSRTGLQPGSYSDTLKIKSPQDGEDSVNVTMTVSGEEEGEGVEEGEQEGTQEGTTEGEQEGETGVDISIIGWVKDTDLNSLAYVAIELLSTSFKVYSDPSGLYTIQNVPKGNYVLSATKEGYAPYSIAIEVGDILPLTVNITLVKQIKILDIPNIENGGTASDSSGNAITLPPNSFFDKVGNPITGPVEVYITPLDLKTPGGIEAFPGGFQGIPSSKQGERVDLESFALADFTIKQNGEEVYLNTSGKEDNPAEITLDLPDDSPLNAGEEVPLWYFDEEKGIWIESGKGTVYNDGGNKYYKAQIQHLSWWNCDAPITDKTCIQGYLKDNKGQPIKGAVVKGVGVSYNGVTTTYSEETGFFCVNVKGNSTVSLEIYLAGGQLQVYKQQIDANTVGNSCETGNCINIGNIIISFNSCIQGTVTDSGGNPIRNVTVYSSAGTEAITDLSGHYCLDAVAGVPITVYIIPRPPVTVVTRANTSCSTGDCVVADITVEYPRDGSYVGIMNVIQSKYSSFMEQQYLLNASALFASLPEKPVAEPNDQCSFQSFQLDYSQGEPNHYMENLPQINWSGLDPGAPGLFQIPEQSTSLIRMSEAFMGEMRTIQPWMFSTFILNYMQPIQPTQTETAFSASWPGGLDIGTFEVTGQIPPELIVTSPEITQTEYGMQTFNFNPEVDLLLQWHAPSTPVSGSSIVVTLTSHLFNEEDLTYNIGTITCILTDDGSHTIPKELLQQLPTQTNGYNYVNLTISRCYTNDFQVPLVRGGNGIFVLQSQTQISAINYSQIPVPAKNN